MLFCLVDDFRSIESLGKTRRFAQCANKSNVNSTLLLTHSICVHFYTDLCAGAIGRRNVRHVLTSSFAKADSSVHERMLDEKRATASADFQCLWK